MEGHEGYRHGSFDPHIWLDPVLAVQQVADIRNALMAANPANAKTIGITPSHTSPNWKNCVLILPRRYPTDNMTR